MAATGLYVFVVQMLTAERPFFDRALFRDRNFMIGNGLFFLVMGNMVGAVVLQPPMLQSLMGHPGTKGTYDRFRGRIMFPISNSTGKIVALAGRVFETDDSAKYVNSPETPICHLSMVPEIR